MEVGNKMPTCEKCSRQRHPDEPIGNFVHALIGLKYEWFSGKEAELCGECFRITLEEANAH